MIVSSVRTLSDSMEKVLVRNDFDFALGNFLDRFKRHPTFAMVSEPPPILRERLDDGGLADAFVAAAAAHLCQLNGLPFPPWVNHKSRIMCEPWFAAKSPNLKAILLQESPAAFRARNLFVSANALSRA